MKRSYARARAHKRFLQLAAVAFALGANTVPSRAEDAATADERSTSAHGATASNDRYRHEFPLPKPGEGDELVVARVEVIPLTSVDAFAVEASGACCVGPLQPGPHAVRVTLGQQVDNHLLRIDRSTGDYLHFTG